MWWCLPVFGGRRSQPSLDHKDAPSCTLASLPLDCIELICKQLSLRDRIAATSCCRALWARPDVRFSSELWGHLSLGKFDAPSERRLASLAHWLERHRGGVLRLRLHSQAPWYHLKGLWIQRQSPRVETGFPPLLRLLASVPGLVCLELRDVGLKKVPAQLAGLTRLEELSLRGNPALGKGGPQAFQPLAACRSLTKLELRFCGLRALPPELSALRVLADLDASVNPLGAGGHEALAPLWPLAVLTRLNLSECALRGPGLPLELALLTQLADLSLGVEPPLEVGDDGAGLAPLSPLTALTRLDFGDCGVKPSLIRAAVGHSVQLIAW